MSTKTMRLPPRRISSSSNNASSNNTTTTTTKRKERDGELDAPLLMQPTTTTTSSSSKSLKLLSTSACSGQLLAGYLAHEFLTRGTLLGQPWDPTTDTETEEENVVTVNVTEQSAQQYEKLERYVEVAALLKTDGAQLAGIVNPTQLARFLQL